MRLAFGHLIDNSQSETTPILPVRKLIQQMYVNTRSLRALMIAQTKTKCQFSTESSPRHSSDFQENASITKLIQFS